MNVKYLFENKLQKLSNEYLRVEKYSKDFENELRTQLFNLNMNLYQNFKRNEMNEQYDNTHDINTMNNYCSRDSFDGNVHYSVDMNTVDLVASNGQMASEQVASDEGESLAMVGTLWKP